MCAEVARLRGGGEKPSCWSSLHTTGEGIPTLRRDRDARQNSRPPQVWTGIRSILGIPGTTHARTAANTMTSAPAHIEDIELVRNAQRGDARARELFVKRMRCVPAMLRARSAKLGIPLERDEFEDLVQDTITAVWSKIGTYGGRAKLETWIYQFCVIEMRSALRARWRRAAVPRPSAATPREDQEYRETAPFEYEDVYAELSRLPAAEGEVVRLKHFSHLTLEEVARGLDLSTNTVKTRYYRALARLRRWLAPVGIGTRHERRTSHRSRRAPLPPGIGSSRSPSG